MSELVRVEEPYLVARHEQHDQVTNDHEFLHIASIRETGEERTGCWVVDAIEFLQHGRDDGFLLGQGDTFLLGLLVLVSLKSRPDVGEGKLTAKGPLQTALK
jgi:hypothetical protein